MFACGAYGCKIIDNVVSITTGRFAQFFKHTLSVREPGCLGFDSRAGQAAQFRLSPPL